jgi:hypothetical protein
VTIKEAVDRQKELRLPKTVTIFRDKNGFDKIEEMEL